MRSGKIVNIDNPIYLLDKKRGYVKIPCIETVNNISIQSLKNINRHAFNANYFEMKVGKEIIRIQRDELREALNYA